MKRKYVILIVVVLAIPGAVYFWQKYHRANSLMLTGIVTTDEVSVSAEIQGRLSQLLVKEGDTVQRHQLLAVIEPQELKADAEYYSHTEEGQSAAVREAEASLKYQELQTRDQIHQAEAALSSAQAQRAESAATLEQGRLDFERAAQLFKQGIDSRQVYDQARTTYDAAKAHLESLDKQVQAQRAALALAESNAEQVTMRRSQLHAQEHQLAAATAQTDKAQVRLAYTEIRAPIDGLVSARAALQGEVVNIGQPIVALINPDDLWVRADVEESYIDRIRLGDKMSVRFPSGMERTGTVFYRGADADYATQRDVSRTKRDIKTFEIRLHVDNRDRRLYPGLTAYVTVPIAAAQ
jgi:HlyD family secretion protein